MLVKVMKVNLKIKFYNRVTHLYTNDHFYINSVLN